MQNKRYTLISFLLLAWISAVNSQEEEDAGYVFSDVNRCRSVTFADGSEDVVCVASGGGGSLSDFVDFYRGMVLENGTVVASDEYIGEVTVGYDTNLQGGGCLVRVNGTDCCSCGACLDTDGETLVGMAADCTNVPNGRNVSECESSEDYFPLDLSHNGKSQECAAPAATDDGDAEPNGDNTGAGDEEKESSASGDVTTEENGDSSETSSSPIALSLGLWTAICSALFA